MRPSILCVLLLTGATATGITGGAAAAQVMELAAGEVPEGVVVEGRSGVLDDQELSCDDGGWEGFIINTGSENWYGNLFELPCDVAHLKSIWFQHYSPGFVGPYSYNLHVLDASCTEILAVNGLTAQNAAGAIRTEVVDLESYGLCVDGDFHIMIEPLSCQDAPASQDTCYPSMLIDLSPGPNPALACSRIRIPSGQCLQFTAGGNYWNYLLRATVECDAPICLGFPDTMVVDTTSAWPGVVGVEVPVTLVNSIPVGGFEFRVEYDPSLLTVAWVNRTPRTEDFEIFGVNPETGRVTVVGIADFVGGDDVPPIPIGTGSIAELVFNVRCDTVYADTNFVLDLLYGSISDTTGLVNVTTVPEDGQFTVLEGGYGAVHDEVFPPAQSQPVVVYPNPTSAGVTIRHDLSGASWAEIDFFDIRGRLVRRVTIPDLPAGTYEYRWDGCDEGGEEVRPGTYFYRLKTESETHLGKLTIVR
jgi:hypothetical protein